MMAVQFQNAVSLWEEMVAYEALYEINEGSLSKTAMLFKKRDCLPSEILGDFRKVLPKLDSLVEKIEMYLSPLRGFSIALHRTFQYPERLRGAEYPPELFYYRGDLGFTESRCVSIIGDRNASDEGIECAQRLASGLVKAGYTIISGLATDIDTAVTTAALENDGYVIGVIGTPITQRHPKENERLQNTVGDKHLLISQVPLYRSSHEPDSMKKRYFVERNMTISALSEATIIVETSEDSEIMAQAQACLQQGRKLFILDSCFKNPDISWPAQFEKKGAIRIRDFDDIIVSLRESS